MLDEYRISIYRFQIAQSLPLQNLLQKPQDTATSAFLMFCQKSAAYFLCIGANLLVFLNTIFWQKQNFQESLTF